MIEKGYKEAVEVGVHRGDFARAILSKWNGTLYGVDPYIAGYDLDDPASQGDRIADHKACEKKLRPYQKRFKPLYVPSHTAASMFQENNHQVDFVYVDAKHRYNDVKSDLEAWWEILKPGGTIAGHDIMCPGEPDGGWGNEIQPAVFEFAKARDLVVYLVPAPGLCPWSYYMVKPNEMSTV